MFLQEKIEKTPPLHERPKGHLKPVSLVMKRLSIELSKPLKFFFWIYTEMALENVFWIEALSPSQSPPDRNREK